MTEKNFEQRLAECERVLRKLEGTSNQQERIRLLREMRQLIQNVEETQKKTILTALPSTANPAT
jgi:hypothetical protein